ncbi:FAD-dependent oxidoreductase [Aquibacillus sp. 3ASR75-11]|uniref:FAD-dependent oxidoreductase n=1 Tax=Terrihalobacillus insolitus TaxID=2950438 RepID=A0A9X3WWI7_9BACI|nr:FAD-dependent oxidoreductase [Terrihalobacillus insolitus]MDC3425446.1 FAD-dependent oxidoreductase [Terrihalobacillus insolitus]
MNQLVIVGAGPAGLSAAIAAAKNGVNVTVIDEFMKPGGRLLGQLHEESNGIWWNGVDEATNLFNEAIEFHIQFQFETSVHHVKKHSNHWDIQTDKGMFKSQALLVATGAAEHSIPLPGWTLPGVMSIGAAQVMANVHHVKPGHHGIIIGINVLSIAIARELKLAGVQLESIVLPSCNLLNKEASQPGVVFQKLAKLAHLAPSPLFKMGGFLTNKLSFLEKLVVRSFPKNGLKAWGIPIQIRRAVIEILGEEKVEGVKVADITPSGVIMKGTEKIIDVDFVCIAGGLYPLTELIGVTACPFKFIPSLGGHVPVHNEQMQTPVEKLYVAGNITGIESAKVAKAQGKVAGLSVAHDLHYLQDHNAIDDAVQHVKKMRDHALIQFHPDINKGRNELNGASITN